MDLLLPKLGLLVWTLLAFLIVFFLLKKMAWPAIIKGLRDRELGITNSLATAEKVRACHQDAEQISAPTRKRMVI